MKYYRVHKPMSALLVLEILSSARLLDIYATCLYLSDYMHKYTCIASEC